MNNDFSEEEIELGQRLCNILLKKCDREIFFLMCLKRELERDHTIPLKTFDPSTGMFAPADENELQQLRQIGISLGVVPKK